ncbi:hypothetical protein [Paenibacillus oralis]|uniref:hypothetical protein n=1 Tax=Paenibacillus oralis TaxID=2490856 RepID=UPI00319E9CCC
MTDPANGIAWPSHGGTPKEMTIWTSALINEDSRFYHREELLHRLELAAEFMLRSQHADGSISPPWTNLHSPLSGTNYSRLADGRMPYPESPVGHRFGSRVYV